MPLTVECYCTGDTTVSVCGITSLTWKGTFQNNTSVCEISLIGPSTHTINANGSFAVDLSPIEDWVDAFPSLLIHAEHNRTLFMPGGPAEDCFATWHIEANYECYRNSQLVAQHLEYAFNQEGDTCECIVSGVRRSFFTIGYGSAHGTIFISTPLGLCNGCGISAGVFEPQFNIDNFIDPESSGPLCLCATGGTPPYTFYVIGSLPSGQTLDRDTGCIEGEADGTTLGSQEIIFGVYDTTHTTAEVTCSIRRGCPEDGGGDGEEPAVLY